MMVVLPKEEARGRRWLLKNLLLLTDYMLSQELAAGVLLNEVA